MLAYLKLPMRSISLQLMVETGRWAWSQPMPTVTTRPPATTEWIAACSTRPQAQPDASAAHAATPSARPLPARARGQ